jgi:hypothetical protein
VTSQREIWGEVRGRDVARRNARSEIDNRGAREDSFILTQQPSTGDAAKLKDVITSSMSTIVDRICSLFLCSYDREILCK